MERIRVKVSCATKLKNNNLTIDIKFDIHNSVIRFCIETLHWMIVSVFEEISQFIYIQWVWEESNSILSLPVNVRESS